MVDILCCVMLCMYVPVMLKQCLLTLMIKRNHFSCHLIFIYFFTYFCLSIHSLASKSDVVVVVV